VATGRLGSLDTARMLYKTPLTIAFHKQFRSPPQSIPHNYACENPTIYGD